MLDNNWGFALFTIVILSCVGAIIWSRFLKSSPVQHVISVKEDERYLEESIAIQPDNSPVFEDLAVAVVIENGMEKMGREKFTMSQGEYIDV